MTTNADDIVTDALIEAISPGATASRATRLSGGVSAQTFALEVTRRDGAVERWVVRHRPPSSARGALSTAEEHALLSALRASGLPVPIPRLMWPPDTMVMECVEGTSALPAHGPLLMADVLARIHAHRGAALEGLPAREDPRPVLERALADEGVEDVERALHASAAGERCLLHGDFWPGNLLWRDGELAAVLDWEDAAVGDPLSDLACARVELEVAAGAAAAATFTERYLSTTGRDPARLAPWDAYVSTSALSSMGSWGLPLEVLEHRRAATRAFLDRAIEALRRRSVGGEE